MSCMRDRTRRFPEKKAGRKYVGVSFRPVFLVVFSIMIVLSSLVFCSLFVLLFSLGPMGRAGVLLLFFPHAA